MHAITINEPGLQSTIQDLGRWGYQHKGYTVSGAMDHFALKVANILVGNAPGQACIEMTFKGVEVVFPCRTVIAITGADMKPSLNGRPIDMWTSCLVNPGDTLRLGFAQLGMRAYLSVKGGFCQEDFLQSKSTSMQEGSGSNKGQALYKGSFLPIVFNKIPCSYTSRRMKNEFIPTYYKKRNKEIRVIEGPFEECFTNKSIQTFYGSEYTVSNEINRVGYRLKGSSLEFKGKVGRLISVSMSTGSIQVPGEGLPIILCVERRTHGGYPVIATIISVDMSKIAQCSPGDKVSFTKVTLDEAHKFLKEREDILNSASSYEPIGPEEKLMSLPDMVDNQYLQMYKEFFE